jgi:hypothetical protein
MAKIKLEIDTEEDGDHKDRKTSRFIDSKNKIAVVSAIKYEGDFKRAFDNGIAGMGFHTQHHHSRGYKRSNRTNLEDSIRHFLTRADLIVTVGGLVAFDAAKAVISTVSEAERKPFLSLVGATPTGAQPDFFWGGVSLESYASNPERVNLLINAGVTAAGIGLIRNKNSSMLVEEAYVWEGAVGNSNFYFAGTDQNDNNEDSQAAFAAGFTAATAAAMRGLVISADPHFQNSRDNFVTAANAWLAADNSRYICYPSLEFRYANPEPVARSILLGPRLEHAYFFLGQIAGAALKAEQSMPVLRMSNTEVRM